MSGFATWDKITGALASTTTSFGGGWGNLISDYLNGIDIGLVDPTKLPKIGTLTRFKAGKLGLYDTDESHEIVFYAEDIDTGPKREIRIRRMNNPNETDYMVLENLTQTLTAKNINAEQNTITNISNDNISATASIATAKLADSSNFTFLNTNQILTNKTLDTINNIIKNLGNSNYEVFSDGGIWYARNTKTGVITSNNASLTTVLQAAINGLTASRTVIETVKVRGTGTLGKITIPSYTRLDLTEFDGLLTANTNDNWFTNSDYVGGNTQIQIIGGLLDGNKSNQSDTTTATQNKNIIYFENVTDPVIIFPFCDNANNDGIRLRNCINAKVDSPNIQNSRSEGISIRGGKANKVYTPYVYNSGWSLMTCMESPGSEFIGGYVDTSGGSSSGVNISSPETKLMGVFIKNAAAAGIAVGDNDSSTIYNPSGSIFESCIVDSSGGPGFACISYPATNIHVRNCEFKNGDDYGIRIGGNVDVYGIESCISHDNLKAGILINGIVAGDLIPTNGIITNNKVYNNGKAVNATDQEAAAISIVGNTTDGVIGLTIENNICFDNQGTKTQKFGVRLVNTDRAFVRFNDLTGNLTDGIQLSGTNNNGRIHDNMGYSGNTPSATTTGTETFTNKTLTAPTITYSTAVGTITLPSTSANFLEFVKPFTNASSESLLRIRLSEDTNSHISIQNMTSTNAVFAPGVILKNNSSAAVSSGYIYGEVHSSFDSGSIAGLTIGSRLHTSAALAIRPIVDIVSGSTVEYSFGGTQADFKNNALINAVINADNNTVTNIDDADIKTGANINYNKLLNFNIGTPAAGDVITWNNTSGKFELAQPPGAGGGEANTLGNVGTGEGTLPASKVGTVLNLKSLKQGSNIALTNNANDVTIDIGSDVTTNSGTQSLSGKTITGLKVSSNPRTANYTALTTDDFIPCAPSGSNITITLPAAASSAGKWYNIVKTNSTIDTVIIDGNASETINGATTYTLTAQYQSAILLCNGTGWFTAQNSSERTGTATGTANGSNTVFNIAHGLGTTPYNVLVQCSTHQNMFTYTADTTNIIVTFGTAPSSSPGTAIFHWRALI